MTTINVSAEELSRLAPEFVWIVDVHANPNCVYASKHGLSMIVRGDSARELIDNANQLYNATILSWDKR